MSKATITIEDHETGQISINIDRGGDFNENSYAHSLGDIAMEAIYIFLKEYYGANTKYSDKNPFIKLH